jgi:5-hydroxyisourate hydrolase
MTAHLTTHILDATAGSPAAGVQTRLTTADGALVAEGRTDGDGRLALGPEALKSGDYTLTFLTGAYFAGLAVDTFYPLVAVSFTVPEVPAPHYHVPLLLSPFAYSTYRGS